MSLAHSARLSFLGENIIEEITVGKAYKHYKGNIYKIIALAKHSETVEDMIVYQSVKNGDIWVRPNICGMRLLIKMEL